MPRQTGRAANRSREDARNRLARAQGFILVAEFVVGEQMESEAHGDLPLSGVAEGDARKAVEWARRLVSEAVEVLGPIPTR